MKQGDKVKVIRGEYSGRIGWIKSVNLLDDGTYTKTNITIIDEHKHTYDVDKTDIELLEDQEDIKE